MNPATIATPTMPGHASDGIVAGSTGWPMPKARPSHDRRRGEHDRADRRHRRAVVGLGPDPVASLPRHPRGQDDPDRVEDGGREGQQQALDRDVGAAGIPPRASTTPRTAIPSAPHARRPSSGRPSRNASTATIGG